MGLPNPCRLLGQATADRILILLLLFGTMVACTNVNAQPPLPGDSATLSPDRTEQAPELFTIPTIVADPDIDKQAYADRMLTIADRWDNNWSRFVNLMVAYEENPSLSYDRDWLMEVEGQAMGLRQMAREIRERQPPPELEAEHAQIVRLTTLTGRAAVLLSEALEEQDRMKWEKGDQLLRAAGAAPVAPVAP